MIGRSGIRRSRFLVTYWENGTHVAYNYLTRASRPCPAVVMAVLEATGHWTSRAGVCEALAQWDIEVVDRTIEALIHDGALEAADRQPDPTEAALLGWNGWNPVAGFFHAATQSVEFDPEVSPLPPGRLLAEHERPPAIKRYPDRSRCELPACSGADGLGAVLRARRTWREFGARDLTLGEISSLLGYTFGVQRWMEVGEDRWVALKTSPSGGARHSIEAYLAAFSIDGLQPGTYHYCPDSHALTLLSSPASPDLLTAFAPAQSCFHRAAAFIVMTSVFARVQWKYPHPHAYRVVLLDAGHLSQTFALVATALGLAPFCTAAFSARAIERHLEIDGVRESVVLALGVGSKPPGTDWTPMRDPSTRARTAPPAWAARVPAHPFP